MDELIRTMSPTTLASLINDIMLLDKGATGAQLRAERLARETLVGLVGEAEASDLIMEYAA